MNFLRFLFSKYFFKHIFYMILIVLFAMFSGIIALRFMTDHGDYVKVPDLKGKTLDSVAIELDKLNHELNGKTYILIGPGRWGTADPWLGIPVHWNQISNAKVIEFQTTFKNLLPL